MENEPAAGGPGAAGVARRAERGRSSKIEDSVSEAAVGIAELRGQNAAAGLVELVELVELGGKRLTVAPMEGAGLRGKVKYDARDSDGR